MGILTLQTCWLILGALAILGLPGLALVQILLPTMPLDQQVGLAPAGSVACWALLWLFGTLAGVPLGPVTIWTLLVVALVVVVAHAYRQRSRLPPTQELWALACLLGLTMVCTAMRLFIWREAVTAMGSDGYHHSLISQLLIEHQALPSNYLPYAPLTSFSYHFAFHTLVASLHMITGRDAVGLTRFMGQIITVASLPPLYSLTRRLGGNAKAGIAAVLFAGALSSFPAFFINWSRFTHSTALVILPAALVLAVEWLDQPERNWRTLLLSSMLVAGLFMAHYSILAFYLYGLTILVLTGLWQRRRSVLGAIQWLERPVLLGLGALVLASPWLYHLSQHFVQQNVLGTVDGSAGAGYFAISLTGIPWASFTNLMLVAGLVGIGLCCMRQRWAFWLMAWALFSIAYSNPYWWLWQPFSLPGLGVVEFGSAFTSCYIPAAVLSGLAWSSLWTRARASGTVWVGAYTLATVAALVWGLHIQSQLYAPGEQYVQQDDLTAAQWLAASTPPNTVIMPDCYAWDWSPNYIISADAGGWMPLLAHRNSIIPPMIRNLEQAADPTLSPQLTGLCEGLRDQPASTTVYNLLRQNKISLIYLGTREGFIDPHKLAALPKRYRLLYQEQDVEIFQVVYK